MLQRVISSASEKILDISIRVNSEETTFKDYNEMSELFKTHEVNKPMISSPLPYDPELSTKSTDKKVDAPRPTFKKFIDLLEEKGTSLQFRSDPYDLPSNNNYRVLSLIVLSTPEREDDIRCFLYFVLRLLSKMSENEKLRYLDWEKNSDYKNSFLSMFVTDMVDTLIRYENHDKHDYVHHFKLYCEAEYGRTRMPYSIRGSLFTICIILDVYSFAVII